MPTEISGNRYRYVVIDDEGVKHWKDRKELVEYLLDTPGMGYEDAHDMIFELTRTGSYYIGGKTHVYTEQRYIDDGVRAHRVQLDVKMWIEEERSSGGP